ncbi:Retrovirus-related Pol polyprotein from transposon TNT 1-94 [Dendrobium catenatum]|uniref:Retrovirus-related Pol polyprotein from transposon TNT 1-94 n=1 Tax=Dendrobium catenatum TaxID=906689 RepID=A0A2I0WPX9_9ASPA|nr:Retrovirus-related Pol polyprotein from transposon TNT 1-94 [Dendrobium catenatum]
MCNSCKMAKSHRLPKYTSQTVTTSPFSLIHSDVWGPFPVTSNSGFRFYVSFIDDFSKFTWVFPITNKSEVLNKFNEFQNLIARQFNTKIKILRSDNGGEFSNKNFINYCNSNGIIHQTSCPYTPSQNGVAERKYRHIIETARTLLTQAALPHHFWVDTVLTANHLINRLPSPNTQFKSPYEILFSKPPDYSQLRVYGCLCYPWLKPYTNNKLSPISQPCVFLGYATTQKGYRCLDTKTNQIYTSAHVIFNESIFPFANNPTTSTHTQSPSNLTPPLLLIPTSTLTTPNPTITINSSQSLNTSRNQLQTISAEPTSSAPQIFSQSPIPSQTVQDHTNILIPSTNPPAPKHPMLTRSQTGHIKPTKIFDLAHIMHRTEPTTYTQAAKSAEWRTAMSQEFQALQSQGTWELVPPDPTQHVLGSKWTFRIKYNSNGSIARHKARLVAKGFNQEHGIDYTETFSPVAKMPTIRVLILIAIHHNWNIHQLDVSNAFLHGNLSDTVYMQQPPGFQDSLHPNYVCRLKKALYGLKQSPREWYSTLSNHLVTYGFQISNSDHSLLTYKTGNIRLYILVYVDDILLTGNSKTELNKLLTNLHDHFQMRNLGTLSQFLGIQASQTESGVILHQASYAKKIVEKAGMTQSKPVLTPIPTKTNVSPTSTKPYDNPHLYRQIIGSLQYLTLTRPDIQFAVQQLCQHMQTPLQSHHEALKRLLRYIHGTTQTSIPLSRSSLSLTGYVDADWASNPQDRSSISGFCNFLGQSPISWQAKNQSTIARSSTEAEYRALATEAAEILWLRRLLEDLHIPQTNPTTVYCDNTSAIALANNPVFHARTKHIEVDCHFIRDCIKKNHISVHHICTEDQLADLFTKPLPTTRFKFLSSKLTTNTQPKV